MVEHDQAFAAQAKGARGWTSFAAVADPVGVNSYRQLLDRTWGENEILPGMPIGDYRSILDFLDNVPAAGQAYAGRWIMRKQEELRSLRHRISGSVLLVDRPLVYMCDLMENHPDRKAWVAQLAGLTSLRAAEWREQGRGRKPVLGVGVRVFADDDDEYSYCLAHEPMRMPSELRRAFEWSFGVANFKTFHTSSLKVGRNEPCPCGSNRKHKRCHGISGGSNGGSDALPE
ncbi:SEC-C metal-binding domain-containing protein [Nonomuraea sp. NEAU-A123]|uniref:YecA family protein n=1 Tax=Nonomuraea sp. NEAU-A123 TaxID=2839649 RepID=UPI001BE40786|nr:SEC-C domain-containing protein [Nonomuraea sp. NEAU-A123]